MTRNLLIASAVLIAAVLALYALVLRPKPQPAADNPVGALVDAAEHLCLSNTTSIDRATIQSQLTAIKGLSATASVGTSKAETRGAVTSLSNTLKAEQDDRIRACMQPYTDKMLTLIH